MDEEFEYTGYENTCLKASDPFDSSTFASCIHFPEKDITMSVIQYSV